MRVLVADDDEAFRALLETMLEQWGYEVVQAADGEEAWRLLQGEEPPSIAILDWMMPGIDGVEVCRKVREAASPAPAYLILLTARNRAEDIVAGLEAGANDYVTKDFEPEELQARVRVGVRVVELESALVRRVAELQEALSHIKTLRGLIPICCYCKKIRNDKEYWEQLEVYITDHTDAEFTHGICPECYEKHCRREFEDFERRRQAKKD